MKLGNRILTASFVSRPNRFMILVKSRDQIIKCHFPNTGRLQELLKPGVKVAINSSSSSTRRTRFDTVAIFNGRIWVSIDSRIPNRLVRWALQTGELNDFRSYSQIKPEYSFRRSRFDFMLKSKCTKCLLEVKSCTLVKSKIAKFPDAPTERGVKHLRDLITAKRHGYRACILFVIQRSDAVAFTPNMKADPQFAKTLNLANRRGVEVYARKCTMRNFRIQLNKKVPVIV